MKNDLAGTAITSRKLAELLGRHLLELADPEDVGRLAQRAIMGIVLDAAGVVSVEQVGTTRRWVFEDGLIIDEEMAVVMYNPSVRYLLDG